MDELTDAARRCLDEYLDEVRSSLRHCSSVDVADVERDVVEHIQHALAGTPGAVAAPELRDVLRGLGSPSQWVPQEELSRVHRALLALRSGPEDLRLGYLAVGLLAGTLLAAACLNLILGFRGTLPFLVLGLAANFLLARASLSAAAGPARAERWLIYPSLIVIYVPVTAVMLLWPLAVAILAEMILTDPGGPREVLAWVPHYPLGTITAFTLATLGSLWWAFFGFVAWRWPEVLRDCYAPFASRFRRRRSFLILSVACLLVFLTCVAVAVGALRGRAPYLKSGPSARSAATRTTAGAGIQRDAPSCSMSRFSSLLRRTSS
jgi:hypothetical protein